MNFSSRKPAYGFMGRFPLLLAMLELVRNGSAPELTVKLEGELRFWLQRPLSHT
jgi:hypothetical protein